MIRLLDITFAFVGLLFSFPLLAFILVIVYLDTGAPIFRQKRVGRYQEPFVMFKFRTMKLGTPSLPTHLVCPSKITSVGRFLRWSKLDELPQLWNLLIGDMSLVGPRPCLYSQKELIKERQLRHVFAHRPGITGLAQVSGIDMSTPKLLAKVDALMLKKLSITNYCYYILMTLLGKGSGDNFLN